MTSQVTDQTCLTGILKSSPHSHIQSDTSSYPLDFLKNIYTCTIAATANYHKLSVSEHIYSFSFRGQKPETSLIIKVLPGLVPSGGSRKSSFPCLFQLPEATGISWHIDTSLSSSIVTLPTAVKSLPSCDYIGPTWIIHGPPHFKILNPICKTPFAV